MFKSMRLSGLDDLLLVAELVKGSYSADGLVWKECFRHNLLSDCAKSWL